VIKVIKNSFKVSVILIALSIFLAVAFSLIGLSEETIITVALWPLLASFLAAIFTNILLVKAGKFGVANVLVWCFGAVILAPISYFFMLYMLGATIEEFSKEQA
jgi:hypothetical protein